MTENEEEYVYIDIPTPIEQVTPFNTSPRFDIGTDRSIGLGTSEEGINNVLQVKGTIYPVVGDYGDYYPVHSFKFPNADYVSTFKYKSLIDGTTDNNDIVNQPMTVTSLILSGIYDFMETKDLIDVPYPVETSNLLVDKMNELISEFIEDSDMLHYPTINDSIAVVSSNWWHSGYSALFSGMVKREIRRCTIRRKEYYSGSGTLWDGDRNLILALAIDKKYLKYYKLCYLTREVPDPRIFTCIMQEEFDTVRTFNKPLRSAFRKYFRKELVASDIPMITMNLVDMHSGEIDTSGVNTISESKQIQKQFVTEYLDSIHEE